MVSKKWFTGFCYFIRVSLGTFDEENSRLSTLMQLLLSFDQDMRVEKTLKQTLTCELSSTLMQLLFPFDQDMRVEKTLLQTLTCQLSSTLMQLLFSFDQDMRVEKTLYKLSLVNSHITLLILGQCLRE